MLAGPVEGATWDGRLVAAPFWANSQLLWYRKSAAARAGLDPAQGPVTWDQVIAGAERAGVVTAVQGARYEGYMVLISALVASAGGQVLDRPEAGRDARPALDTPAGHGGRPRSSPASPTPGPPTPAWPPPTRKRPGPPSRAPGAGS